MATEQLIDTMYIYILANYPCLSAVRESYTVQITLSALYRLAVIPKFGKLIDGRNFG